MNEIEVKLSVSIFETKANRTTVVDSQTTLPCLPPLGATITVPSGDEAVPLRVDLLEFVLGRSYVNVSTAPHPLSRILEDGTEEQVGASEIVQLLMAAGFRLNEVIEGDEGHE